MNRLLKCYLPNTRCLLLLVALMLGAQAALAHNSLKSSMPGDGAVINVAPDALELVFSDSTYLVSVTVTPENGKQAPLDFEPPLDYSPQFRVPLPMLAPGRYTVDWKVEGQDTHIIEGKFSFTVKGGD